jgi:DNA recombination protein RmuC
MLTFLSLFIIALAIAFIGKLIFSARFQSERDQFRGKLIASSSQFNQLKEQFSNDKTALKNK